MAAPARHSATKSTYDAFDAEEHFAHRELFAGERVSPPLSRTGGKATLWFAVVLIAIGGGWALLGDQASWPRWLLAETAAMFPSMDRKVPAPVAPVASAMTTISPPAIAEPATKPAALAAPPPAPQPSAPTKTAAAPDVTAGSAGPPLRSPTADAADPYQMRAEAVGLHPDLSRALLARLSPADYRNAGIAIQTALAETPDSVVFVWPRQRKPELALFRVSFVPGAAPGCRRYVVTVTKDGWLTTALPMERCGSQLARARRE